MITKKIRRLLQKEGPRGRPSERLSKTFTFISGRRMTTHGCECVVSLAEVRRSEGVSTASVLRRRRTVLPGVAPGELLRTRPQHFAALTDASVSAARALPRQCHTLRVGPSGVLAGKPRPPLPCPSAGNAAECQLCPWMAVGAELSGRLKAEVVREAVDGALAQAMVDVRVDYLDPFPVPPRLHNLQEAEFAFVREAPLASAVGQEERGEEGRGAQGHFRFVTHPSRPSATTGAASSRAARSKAAALMSPTAATAGEPPQCGLEDCVLATLEQKRLAASLSRWAAQLPAPMRGALDRVYVAQPSASDGTGSGAGGEDRQHAPWQASLLVTVTMRLDVEGWGPQSPLCGPSHPPEVLSVEEQALVDAVMEAAPLIQRIAVQVMFTPSTAEATRGGAAGKHSTTSRDAFASAGRMDCLYPVTARDVAVADALKKERLEPDRTVTRQSFGPSREVVCHGLPLAEEMDRPHRAHIPGMHSTALWLGLMLARHGGGFMERGGRAISEDAEDAGAVASMMRALPLASFWRHSGALDAACSILLSALAPATARKVKAVAVLPPSLRGLRTNAASAPASMVLSQALSRLADQVFCPGEEEAKGMAEASGAPRQDTDKGIHLVAAVLNNAEADKAALLRCLPRRDGAQVRLLLVQCSTDMKATALHDGLVAVGATAAASGTFSVTGAEAGAVDVDPLSAACVVYAVLELRA